MVRKNRREQIPATPTDEKEIVEKRLRKKIVALARAAGGRIGMTRMARKIGEAEGEAGANAAVSLAFIMQEEGLMKVDIDQEQEIITVELTDDESSEVLY